MMIKIRIVGFAFPGSQLRQADKQGANLVEQRGVTVTIGNTPGITIAFKNCFVAIAHQRNGNGIIDTLVQLGQQHFIAHVRW